MHKNQIWLAFLATITLIVLWFSVITGYKIYTFYALTGQTPATQTEWNIVKQPNERFLLHATFSYQVKDRDYNGETTLKHLPFRNRWAAEQTLPEYTQKKWVVWFAPKNPEFSTIRKSFPLKELTYAGVMWTLLIYFIWLGYYVGKNRNNA